MRSILYFLLLLLAPLASIQADTHPTTTSNRHEMEEPPLPPSLQVADKPATAQEDTFYKEFLNMLFTLGMILAVLLALSWVVRRMTNNRMKEANDTSAIKIIDRRSISPKTVIYLIDVNGKGIAVAESHTCVVHLGNVPVAKDEAPPFTPFPKQ